MNNNLYNVCELAKYAADMSVPVEDLPVPEAGSEGVAGMTNNTAMNPTSVGSAVYASPAEQMQLAKAKEIAAEAMAKQAATASPEAIAAANALLGKTHQYHFSQAPVAKKVGPNIIEQHKKHYADLGKKLDIDPSDFTGNNPLVKQVGKHPYYPKVDVAPASALSRAKNWISKNPRYAGAAALGALGALGAGAYAYGKHKEREKTAAPVLFDTPPRGTPATSQEIAQLKKELAKGRKFSFTQAPVAQKVKPNIIEQHKNYYADLGKKLDIDPSDFTGNNPLVKQVGKHPYYPKVDVAPASALSRAKNWISKNPRYAGAAALGALGALGAGAYAYSKRKDREKTAAEYDEYDGLTPNQFYSNRLSRDVGRGAAAGALAAGLGAYGLLNDSPIAMGAAGIANLASSAYGARTLYDAYKQYKTRPDALAAEKTASAYETGVFPEEAMYAMDSAEALYADSLNKLAYAEDLYADAAECLDSYNYLAKQANEYIPLAGSALGGAVGSVAGEAIGARFNAPRVGAAVGAAVGAPSGAALANFVDAARGADGVDPNVVD